MKSTIKYSVIIPTYNNPKKLRTALEHLTKLQFDKSLYEIIVVDNRSTDNTREICDSFSEAFENYRYCFCASPGLMAARHMGLFNAAGDILCYLDEDSYVDALWLQGTSESFSDPSVAIATGPCIPRYEVAPPDWLAHYNVRNELGVVNGFLSLIDFGEHKQYIPSRYVFGCNYAIRKSVLIEVGGTHPDYLPMEYREYVGDGETGIAPLLEQCGKAHYHPLARIEHYVPASRMTIEYFSNRAFYVGIGTSYNEIRTKVHPPKMPGTLSNWHMLLKKNVKKLKILWKYRNDSHRHDAVAISGAMFDGYFFHRKKLKSNPLLFEWIRKPSYLDEGSDIISFVCK